MSSPATSPLPLEGDDVSQLPSYRVFAAFHQLMHSNRQLMARKMAGYGAHPGQTFCLRQIARDDGITQRDLAERLNVTRPTVTVMLQKMEKSGLIERRGDERDQRYTRIYLTDAGRVLHSEMGRMLDELVVTVVGSLSEKDQDELVRLLGALNDNIRAALDESGHGEPAHDEPRRPGPSPDAPDQANRPGSRSKTPAPEPAG